MKKIIILIALLMAITACAPDLSSIESRLSTLEAPKVVSAPILIEPIADSEPRFYAGDEDVSDLLDTLWIELSGESVEFGVEVRSDALSGNHGGILYVIPGEDIQKEINATGYDVYTTGVVQVFSGDKSPTQRSVQGVARWVNLPESHPKAGNRAIMFYLPAYEHWKISPYDEMMSLKVSQLANESRMDIPWHAHYGFLFYGSISISWRR